MRGLVRFVFAALIVSSVVLLPTPSFATPVSGSLTMSGDASVGAAGTFLTFLCDFVSGDVCPANSGDFRVGGPVAQSGSFIAYSGDNGYIKSLNEGPQPLNTLFTLADFITFSPTGTVIPPDIAFDLNFIGLGTEGQADCLAPANPSQVPAQACTPIVASLVTPNNPLGLSPFNLVNTSNGSTASFTVAGTVRRLSTGETSHFIGEFTAVFTSTPGTTDKSYQALLADFEAGNPITTGYSAQFNAIIGQTVPEPGTISLAFGGLLIVAGCLGRRKFKGVPESKQQA